MTTPSLMKSFDTSLVEVQRSFSSTETMTSGSGSSAKENQPPPQGAEPASASRQFKDVTDAELYEQWAPTYDTDGNVLQTLDDIKKRDSIAELVRNLQDHAAGDTEKDLNIIDFGCGTGRSTLKLLTCPWNRRVTINAWDSNLEMLNIAKAKCGHAMELKPSQQQQQQTESHGNVTTSFRVVDFGDVRQLPIEFIGQVDGLISTLVRGNVPLDVYWKCIAALLKPGGVGLMSNMHPDMGSGSVAGSEDESGQRLAGKAFVHGVQDTAEAARKAGLEVWDVEEEEVDESIMERVEDGYRGREWAASGKKVWIGMKFTKPLGV